MGDLRVCTCDKRPDRHTGKPGIDPATGKRWTFETLPRCDCPLEADLLPTIIRQYIICPDCGRSAPDAGDGLCQDCRDHARLRAAVGEWRHAADALNVGQRLEDAERYADALQALAELARELGLDGGAA